MQKTARASSTSLAQVLHFLFRRKRYSQGERSPAALSATPDAAPAQASTEAKPATLSESAAPIEGLPAMLGKSIGEREGCC